MLRPPAEVVGSKQTYYANKLGSAHLAASWLNMLLHTERGTRESVAGRGRRSGVRAVRRPARRLDQDHDAVGEQLQLQNVLHANSEQIRDGHRFVDPSLRRMAQSLDDLGLPKRLHELDRRDLGGAQQAGRARRRHPRGARDPRPAARGLHRPLRRVRGDLALLGGGGRAGAAQAGQGRRPGRVPAAAPPSPPPTRPTRCRTACAPPYRRRCAGACARWPASERR